MLTLIFDIPQLAEATLKLLREDSCCQQVESDSDMEEGDDSDMEEGDNDHDEVLMDAESDLLPAFA